MISYVDPHLCFLFIQFDLSNIFFTLEETDMDCNIMTMRTLFHSAERVSPIYADPLGTGGTAFWVYLGGQVGLEERVILPYLQSKSLSVFYHQSYFFLYNESLSIYFHSDQDHQISPIVLDLHVGGILLSTWNSQLTLILNYLKWTFCSEIKMYCC